MKTLLLALSVLAFTTGAYAGPSVHPVLQPSPHIDDLPASQWWPQGDPRKGAPGGDA